MGSNQRFGRTGNTSRAPSPLVVTTQSAEANATFDKSHLNWFQQSRARGVCFSNLVLGIDHSLERKI
uniref:Uncharacterized protein n=1 Tax=Lepeophtheirus salmonis TaxID=72036 RepID=A0A0K2V8T9_LEPSM